MKVIILDGSQESDTYGERVRKALITELQNRCWDMNHVVIREQKIGNCAGDFYCWIRNPGICNVNDENRRIAEAIVGSDLLVYLTPVTFGGYSSILKRMVDHQIQNILPHFAKIDGETHHRKRYDKYPDFLTVGWMDSPDVHAEEIFRYLTRRNAINFHAETEVCGIVSSGQSDEEINASVKTWLSDVQNGRSSQSLRLPKNSDIPYPAPEVRRALLLVGSPKTRKSSSNFLGEYLFEQLGRQSIHTETVYLHTTVRSAEKMNALFEAIDLADLVTLAFPLYVDSLPSPVIDALEQIAAYRRGQEQNQRPLFTAISNCGFPEADHNATALAICENFAGQAKLQWAGSLALGGGGIVDGRPLAESGGRTIKLRKSLDLAAAALAQGHAIPSAAQELMAKPVIPAWLYRMIGSYGWKQQAKQFGMQKSLKRQPYLADNKD